MYILTNKENVIIAISSVYELDEEHRNIKLDGYNIAYGPDEVINHYEVEEVPEGVQEQKYCYTETNGFILNTEWKEPQEKITLEELQQQVTDLQLAVVELAEGGM